jgi:hypothetical protein
MQCDILIKLEFSRQKVIFEKYSNIKFYENSSRGSRVVSCGRTDIHDKTNGYIWKFCERALKTNFYCILQSCAKCFDTRAIFTVFSNTDD